MSLSTPLPQPASARGGQHPGWPLAAILLFALALRLWGSDYALWYDEIASTRFAAMPWRQLWSDWMISETNPPLYYSLLKLWTEAVGGSDGQVRLLSTVIGLGGIACAWQFGRNLGGYRAAVVAGLLVASSQQHVFYSQMARGYGLGHSATLLALVGLTGLARVWWGQPASASRAQLPGLMVYTAGAVVAVYSHTTLVLVPVLANLWAGARFAADGWQRRRLPPGLPAWATANLAVLVAWAWWARITWLQSAQMGSNIGWIARPSVPYAVRMTLESYVPWPGVSGLWAVAGGAGAILFGGLFGWALWRHRSDAWRRGLDVVALFAVGAPVLLFAISLARPIFLPRTVYFAAGPFLVVVALGLTALPRRLFAAALALALVLDGVAGVAWFRNREVEPWRAVAAAVSAPGMPRTLAVQGVGPAFALARYCREPACGRRLLMLPSPQVDHWAGGMARPLPAAGPDDLARALDCGQALAVLRWSSDDPAAELPSGAVPVGEARTWGPGRSIGLSLWTRPGGRPSSCAAR